MFLFLDTKILSPKCCWHQCNINDVSRNVVDVVKWKLTRVIIKNATD